MPDEIPDRWTQLQDAFTLPEGSSILVFVALLILGGALAIYLRFLYRLTAPRTASDSIAKVFPLLTLVTIAVISVVKSSLALSLGLVGALSIVRFRAAIKDPEELVFLFLCIGVGLALGAQQVWLSLALVVTATVFILGFDRFRRGAGPGTAYLTITGSAPEYFADEASSALARVRAVLPDLMVDRCSVEGDEGQLRVQLRRVDAARGPELVGRLRSDLPGCAISFVSADRIP